MRRNETILLTTIAGAAFIAALVYYIKRNKKYIAMPTQVNPGSSSGNSSAESTDYRKLAVGYRQNNPLNIRVNSANNWKGKISPSDDPRFEQFSDMAYGYRAAFILMRNHIKKGENTVAKLISTWAPANENHTNTYINFVCEQTGYLPATILSPDNSTQLKNMAYAMSIFENGWKPLPDKTKIDKGWELL